jgi:hypothetical protein
MAQIYNMTVEINLPAITTEELILLLVSTNLTSLQRNEEEKMEMSSKCHDFDFGMAPMIDRKAWAVQGI